VFALLTSEWIDSQYIKRQYAYGGLPLHTWKLASLLPSIYSRHSQFGREALSSPHIMSVDNQNKGAEGRGQRAEGPRRAEGQGGGQGGRAEGG